MGETPPDHAERRSGVDRRAPCRLNPVQQTHQDEVCTAISKQVAGMRELLGYSQERAALISGTAVQTILNLEKAKTDPLVSTLVCLALGHQHRVHVSFEPLPAPPTR